MNIYYTIYSIFFLFYLNNFEINKNNFLNNKLIIAFTFLLLFIFIGFRDSVGGDWIRYYEFYENIEKKNIQENFGFEEKQKPFFFLLNLFSSYYDLGFNFVIIIAAFLFSFSLIIFCIYSGNLFFGLIIAFPLLVIIISMGFVAQSLAISFLMIAYISFVNQKIFKTIVLIVLGSLFHPSVIIYIVPLSLYVLFKQKINLKYIISFFVFIFFLYLINYRIFYSFLENYIFDGLSSRGAVFRLLLNLISVIAYFIFTPKNSLPSNGRILINFFCISSVVSLIFCSFNIATTAIDRVMYFFYPIQIYILTNFINYNFDIISRKFISSLLFFIYLIFMAVWFNYSNFSSDWLPYNNILF